MNKHDLFEDELKKVMRRVDAPQSLEVYLLNAVEAEQQAARRADRAPRFRKLPLWLWNPLGSVVAAVLVLGCFGAEGLHLKRQHDRVALATEEFEASQRITDHALEHARERLQRAGISLEQ